MVMPFLTFLIERGIKLTDLLPTTKLRKIVVALPFRNATAFLKLSLILQIHKIL